MKVEIRGKSLIITMPIELPLKKSFSGKTLIVVSTHGNKEIELDLPSPLGVNLVKIGVNAYMYPPSEGKQKKGKKLTKKQSKAIEERNREITKKMEEAKKE